ncbi:MAG: dolichol-phosphate mannosyltransferase [Hydrococcus sp. Prado102]|jgi:hypothetical protein|nr:dolichol-phosphate mannosyltransferase [Hydrococcus sp. Prado102]
MKLKLAYIPLAIVLAGVLFSLYLLWQVPNGVYFSGDAGLKALLARQLSAGIFRFDLVPPSDTWVRELWKQGLYPYDKPFVYEVASKYFITFPFTFALITAPFLALFGDRGLYLVPLVSTWAIWLTFYWVCLRLKFNAFYTSIALVFLIFASPLTIYAAMYWEHTLAVALAFAGTAILLVSQSSGLSIKDAIISGILVGLSVWFRPEFLCWVGILAVSVYLASLSQVRQFEGISQKLNLESISFLSRNKTLFVASMVVTIGMFFLCNQIVYGHPLGIHAIQVVQESSLAQKLRDSRKNFQGMGVTFFTFFPIAFFLLIYPFFSFFKNRGIKVDFKLIILYLICLFFTIGVSLIVPPGTAGLIPGGKQWGARFLLILIPVVALLVTLELSKLKENALLRYGSLFIISVLAIIGIHKNSYRATVYLHKNHQGILPAIQFIQNSPDKVIAISHQFVAQAIEPAVSRDKLFFDVETLENLKKLATALIEQNQINFLYICYPHRPCELPETTPEALKIPSNNQEFDIKFSQAGEFGKYPIYEVVIIGRSPL